MTGLEFPVLGWVVLAAAALLIGISKTSIGGLGTLAVAGFALFIPARESTAAVLLLLIIADLVAVIIYRRSADWSLLRSLLPAVLPGVVLGALVIAVIDNRTMMLLIAACILVAFTIQLLMRRREAIRVPAGAAPPVAPRGSRPHPATTIGTGVAAGFTTMVANAAGPVMALYLLAARVDKMRFVGTLARYALIVNVAKVPFSIGLGLMTTSTLWLTLALAPAVLIGTWLGRRFLRRLPQRRFEQLTMTAALIAGVALLVRGLL